ncbi:glycosyltransferase family 2 protein [Croceiramulus getboli]|nr:glycosyltransferase family 2 protein [Flavobacteriaceae bacterium YJPT1-3]
MIEPTDAPVFSVIMPVFNAEDFLKDAVNSVIDQTYASWELILIDDASTDGSQALISAFAKAHPQQIQCIQFKSNQGTAKARNAGIERAKGRFICFLDADDRWMPEKLEKQYQCFMTTGTAVCFSSYVLMQETGELLHQKVQAFPELPYSKLLKANYIGNLTGAYDTQKLGKCYSPLLRKRQDWALWLEVIRKGGSAVGIQQPLAVYRKRKGSISANKLALLKYNFLIYYSFLDYPLVKSLGCMLVFLREQLMIKPRQTVPYLPKS